MSVNRRENLTSTETTPDQEHPAWCDRARCTANPAATAPDGDRSGTSGQHRSAPIPLDLTTALWLPERAGTAYLTEAVAPWSCTPSLHIRIGDTELSMPVDHAAPVLAALSALVVSAHPREGVSR